MRPTLIGSANVRHCLGRAENVKCPCSKDKTTVVLLELERRGYTVDWVRTEDGWEVDFFAQRTGDTPLLVQVCLDTAADSTWEREVRALTDAAHAYPDARALLITLDPTPPTRDLPAPLEWRAASQCLLAADSAP